MFCFKNAVFLNIFGGHILLHFKYQQITIKSIMLPWFRFGQQSACIRTLYTKCYGVFILTLHNRLCNRLVVRVENTMAVGPAGTNRCSNADTSRAMSSHQLPENNGPRWVRHMMCMHEAPSVKND